MLYNAAEHNLQHPNITAIESTGHLYQLQVPPACPHCDAYTDEFYIQDGVVVGCPNCLQCRDAYEWEER